MWPWHSLQPSLSVGSVPAPACPPLLQQHFPEPTMSFAPVMPPPSAPVPTGPGQPAPPAQQVSVAPPQSPLNCPLWQGFRRREAGVCRCLCRTLLGSVGISEGPSITLRGSQGLRFIRGQGWHMCVWWWRGLFSGPTAYNLEPSCAWTFL